MLNGIDVASFQHPNGAAINWAQVAGAGYQFAAIKATEGTYTSQGTFYVNPYYASDAQAAVAAGMYVAAYHFANPFNSTGAAQADFAAQQAGAAQGAAEYQVGGHYLPLLLDLEYNPYSPADGGNQCYGLSPAQMVTWISSFMTEATTLTGAAPIIYTPQNWWDLCTGSSTAFGGDVLWVPAYSAAAPGTLPAGWNTWTMWQYTSSGSVPGITGSVDLDYFSGGPQAEQTAVNTSSSVQIYTLNALAGQQVTYTATGLPPGLTISPTGLITGTPTAGGSYTVTVTASGPAAVLPATVSFTWDVTQPQAPAITSGGQVTFGTGVASTFAVTATGTPAPTFSESGALPSGVTFGTDGVLSGTPSAGTGGRYPIQITASNGVGTPATQAFTLVVDVPGAPLPAGGVLGDINGDGVGDILAMDSSGNLWLYPNSGSGDANMFSAGRSKVGSGWSGYTLAAVAPLYGSARAGILARDSAGNLWYYPNTGGTGTSTFGARTQVGSAWNGYTVVGLTSLYGSGGPGILARDSAGNLWYYPNTGKTGTATFGARSQVGSGWTGYTVNVADVNGDGKPDLLAVDTSGTMWLYPSTGGTGTSTFGARTQVADSWSGYQAIDVGSLTRGGTAADILGIDPSGHMWYYPNRGGTGTSTFGAPVQVGSGWTGFKIN
jgi:GH25 family lysozyme M1 (1,4-beta-N-acetylmuramidase)